MVASNKEQLMKNKKRTYSRACIGLSVFIGVVLLFCGILVAAYFRGFVDGIIKSELPIVNGSKISEAWMSPPVKPLLKFTFFNFTNPTAFLNPNVKAKPKLQEVGPYVYEVKWERINVEWSSDGKDVTFGTKKTFFFRPELSVGSDDDLMMLPNIPVISALRQMKYSSKLVRAAFGQMLKILDQTIFSEVSVRDVIWGHDHPIVELANGILPKEKRLPFDKFGFFVGRNESSLGNITMMTGKSDVSRIGEVLAFNGQRKLSFWDGEECNAIRGTDGSIFHPDLKKDETLRIFNRNLCQSLRFEFEKEVESNGIHGYRFVPPADVFAKPSENPSNQCFYSIDEEAGKYEGSIAPSGLFNLSKCQHDTPLFLSWPHFFQADPALLEMVSGLSPSKEKHQFYVDIQPKLGNGLGGAARSQINVHLEEVDGIKQAEGLRDMYLPVVWFEEVVTDIKDEETLALLHKAIHEPERARTALLTVCFIVGSLLILLVPLVAFACHKWRRLKTKTTNYVVNGASRQVSTETSVSSISRKVSTDTTTSYISNGNGCSKEKDDEIHIVENGKSANNGTAEKQENKPKSFLKSNSYFKRIEKSIGKLY